MRAIVNAETFAAALKSVEKVRGSSMISELQGMEVRFSEEFCAMTATDLATFLPACGCRESGKSLPSLQGPLDIGIGGRIGRCLSAVF